MIKTFFRQAEHCRANQFEVRLILGDWADWARLIDHDEKS